jgi:hypothetical protein
MLQMQILLLLMLRVSTLLERARSHASTVQQQTGRQWQQVAGQI